MTSRTATITTTTDGITDLLNDSATPLLVEFWASWCQHCRALAPTLDDFAAEHADLLRVATINAEENRALAEQHAVSSLPTMILFKDGQPVKRIVGATGKAALHSAVAEYL